MQAAIISREDYLKMDPVEFRARFREMVHHTLEIQTYEAIHAEKTLPEAQTMTVKELMAKADACKGILVNTSVNEEAPSGSNAIST